MPTTMYDDDELKKMFANLAKRFDGQVDNGFRYKLQVVARPSPLTKRGLFAPEHNIKLARVWIYVDRDIGPERFRMLCALAHELGHARSFLDGNHTAQYDAATVAFDEGLTLLPAQQDCILDEERRAWSMGCDLVQSVGFVDCAAYEQEANRALGFYYSSMGRAQVPLSICPVAGPETRDGSTVE